MSPPRRVEPVDTGRLAELGLHAASLVHELRQPLAAVKALAEMVEAGGGPSTALATALLEQVRTIDALIESYADFSRRPRDDDELFDVRLPVRSAALLLERTARSARVRWSVDEGEAVLVRGSRLAVQQALVNLGKNAIDALRTGVGTEVRITWVAEADRVRLRVEDDGPGLPDEVRARLFEPFQTTKVDGTGLGLYLSREALVRSGAELRLLEGGGTRWELLLPR